jgi:hypothetical protein
VKFADGDRFHVSYCVPLKDTKQGRKKLTGCSEKVNLNHGSFRDAKMPDCARILFQLPPQKPSSFRSVRGGSGTFANERDSFALTTGMKHRSRIETPYRFRSKPIVGCRVATQDSAQRCYVNGQLQCSKAMKIPFIWWL